MAKYTLKNKLGNEYVFADTERKLERLLHLGYILVDDEKPKAASDKVKEPSAAKPKKPKAEK